MIAYTIEVLSDIKNQGKEIILVTSGAVGIGMGKLGITERPRETRGKQALAAIGQCELMDTYDRLFASYGHTVAQILLTGADFQSPERHENFSNTMSRLLELSVLPIINENDTVSTAEIMVGDNDTLSALVASSVSADLLILLSDIDGLYTADPHKDPTATVIPAVYALTEKIMALGGSAGSSLGTGGMQTKLRAAKIAGDAGCDMIITNGDRPCDLYAIIDDMPVGTRFFAKK